MRLLLCVLAVSLVTTADASAAGRRSRVRFSEPQYSASPAISTTVSTSSDAFGAELLALHNAERARSGLPPLTMDPALATEAQAAASEQARRGRIGHWLPIRGGSENAACGQCSERETHADWMASSGHRRNVLGPWTSVGFARVGSFWTARYR